MNWGEFRPTRWGWSDYLLDTLYVPSAPSFLNEVVSDLHVRRKPPHMNSCRFFEENQPNSKRMEPLGTLPFAVSRQNSRNRLQKSAELNFPDWITFESRTFLAEWRSFRNEK
jgi:hypothetical protein